MRPTTFARPIEAGTAAPAGGQSTSATSAIAPAGVSSVDEQVKNNLAIPVEELDSGIAWVEWSQRYIQQRRPHVHIKPLMSGKDNSCLGQKYPVKELGDFVSFFSH